MGVKKGKTPVIEEILIEITNKIKKAYHPRQRKRIMLKVIKIRSVLALVVNKK